MGGLSVWHWVVLALAFVVLFGASRLPHLARSIVQSRQILRAELNAANSDTERNAPDALPKSSDAD